MGVYGGPNISTEGLVLHLDAGNSKSFRGEPTTNVVANSIPTNSWTVANFGGSTTTRTFLSENGIPFMRFTDVINASDYPRMVDSVFTNTITGTFSVSMEVRGTPNAQLRFRIYENGSTKITNTITLTSEWTRVEFNNQTTSFILNQPYFNPVTTGAIYDIRNIQVEAKPYSTPHVNGTRGTTVATGGGIIDISDNLNNGELVNNPIFNSNNNGSLVFDGANTYLNFIVNDNARVMNNGFTLNTFVYVNNLTNSTTNFISSYVSTGAGTAFAIKSYFGKFEFRAYGLNLIVSSNSNLPLNQWVMLTAVWKPGEYFIYINGILDRTGTTSFTYTPSSSNIIRIGGGATSMGTDAWLDGRIAIASIYNTHLNSSEIFNIYNSFKNRFL